MPFNQFHKHASFKLPSGKFFSLHNEIGHYAEQPHTVIKNITLYIDIHFVQGIKIGFNNPISFETSGIIFSAASYK